MFQDVKTPRLRQVLAAASAGLVFTSMMSSWGFPAAALPQMEQLDSPIHFTVEQSSWFATVTLMLSIPGALLGSTICEVGGPRRIMLFFIPVLCVSTMAMVVGSWKVVQDAGVAEIFLLISRAVQGSATAILNPVVPVYSYEICDQLMRGTTMGVIEVWATLGYLLCYIAGCFLSWSTIAWLLPLITLVPAFIGICLSPESPLWLARKGREEEARLALKLVRCTEEEVSSDLKTVRNSLEEDDNSTCLESFQKVAKKSNATAMAASCLVLIMKELGGVAILSIYVVHIFNEAGVGLDPRWSSVVVGVARITCNGFASFMLHRFSRRLILVVGNILTGTATLAIGVFFFLQNSGEDVSWLSWLPLVGLVVYTIGNATSINPTTWTVALEVLPGPVRSLGMGVSNTCYATTAFFMSKIFLDLKELIGLNGVFWIFTGSAACYIALVLLFIPETQGLSLQDIEDYWQKPKKGKKEELV